VQTNREGGDEKAVPDNDGVAHVDEPLAAGVGIEVGAVQIVSADGADGDQLAGGGAGDGHEDNQKSRDSTALAEQGHGGVREHQAGADIAISHAVRVGGEQRRVLHGQGGETHGGGRQPRDGEPAETTNDVAGKGVDGGRGDGLVVVAVVEEDGAEVACRLLAFAR